MPDTPTQPGSFVRLLRTLLGPIASLKITVALFVLASLLVFFGTLAQKGQGVWTVVDNYFYSWFVQVEFKYLVEFGKVFLGVHPDATSDWAFPFPAGKLLGWAMVVNLTAAHVLQLVGLIDGVRKQASRTRSTAADITLTLLKRSGIFVLHGGVLFMLVGEYVTREYAVEQQMLISEGGASNYAFETRNFELAFVDRTDPHTDKVAVLPAKKMKAAAEARDPAARRISHPDLPVDVEVVAYFPNSKVREIAAALKLAMQNAIPDKEKPGREAVLNDVVAVMQAFDEALKHEPKGPPLPLFQKVLAEAAPGKFASEGGREALAAIEAAVAEMKGQQQATTGVGLTHVATFEPEVTGVDTTQKIDLPSAYVTLFDKKSGESLGVYLVSSGLMLDGDPPQAVPGQAATVELRPTRHYKAYTVHLADVRADHYVGTRIPKNYSSDVRLDDPGLNQDRNVTIRMNEPLRHRGDAIFQSSVSPTTGDPTTTGLQVVSNPGWTMPYISCVLVALGMLLHFCIKMSQFVLRAVAGVKAAPAPKVAAVPSAALDLTSRTLPPLARWGVPVGAAVLAGLLLAGLGMPRKPQKERLDLQKLATVPVVDSGRVKPLDSVARVNLRQITHAEEYTDAKGVKRSALVWFLDTATSSPEASDGIFAARIFRVENDQVRDLLKLPRREGLRYSVNDIREGGQFAQFLAEYRKADELRDADDKSLTLYQSKVLEVGDHITLSQAVMGGGGPLVVPADGDQEWQTAAAAREKADPARFDALQRALPRIRERLKAEGVPTGLDNLTDEQKATLDRVGKEEVDKELPHWARASAAWDKVLSAYTDNDPKAFDAAVADYRALVAERVPAGEVKRAELETFLNQSALYYWCTVLYGVAGGAGLLGFVLLLLAPKASQTIRRGVFWWLVVTFLVHTFTLLARMYLMDRPLVFVTNLYSSAVFIGWAVMLLCLILEVVFPVGFGNLTAAVLGFATCIIAHNLAASGDTLEMMRAVLDTNFWLATHVTTVTIGYAATYVAGVLGLMYVLLYILPEQNMLRRKVVIGSGVHQLNYDIGKILGTLTYSVVCFATLFSFVGTVLGGIWADQSWGRFWGWDPKENGAVLIVLWNALILHARWGGMVKERGMAVLSIVGIIITTWSWFGTNQLGVGLHAYGFNNGLVRLCDGVWIGSLIAVLVGVLPWQWVYRGGGPPMANRV
jgi:ABC-type transport system involved in cytochrome c biogenesis permease subunit